MEIGAAPYGCLQTQKLCFLCFPPAIPDAYFDLPTETVQWLPSCVAGARLHTTISLACSQSMASYESSRVAHSMPQCRFEKARCSSLQSECGASKAQELTAPHICRVMSLSRPRRYHSSMFLAGNGPCVCPEGSTYLHLHQPKGIHVTHACKQRNRALANGAHSMPQELQHNACAMKP